jgi:hypothetical protein
MPRRDSAETELFPVLRSIVDRSGRKGQALILGPRPETSSVRVLNPLRGEYPSSN